MATEDHTLISDEEIVAMLPATVDAVAVLAVLDEDPGTKIYPTRNGRRDPVKVRAKLEAMGVDLTPNKGASE